MTHSLGQCPVLSPGRGIVVSWRGKCGSKAVRKRLNPRLTFNNGRDVDVSGRGAPRQARSRRRLVRCDADGRQKGQPQGGWPGHARGGSGVSLPLASWASR